MKKSKSVRNATVSGHEAPAVKERPFKWPKLKITGIIQSKAGIMHVLDVDDDEP